MNNKDESNGWLKTPASSPEKKKKFMLIFSLLLIALMVLGLWLKFYGTQGYIVLPEPNSKNYTFKMNSFMDAKYRFLLLDNSNKHYYFIDDLDKEKCREFIEAKIATTINDFIISGMFAPVSCMRKNDMQPILILLAAGKYVVKVNLGKAHIKNYDDNAYELLVGMRGIGKGFLWMLRGYLYYGVVPFGLFYFLSLAVFFLGTSLFKWK